MKHSPEANKKYYLAKATNGLYSLSVATIYLVNISELLALLGVFSDDYEDVEAQSPDDRAIWGVLYALTFMFFLGLLKPFDRLISKAYNLKLEENPFWKTTWIGRHLERSLASYSALYRTTFMSIVSGSLFYKLTDNLPFGIISGTILSGGTMVSQYALFVHSNLPSISANEPSSIQPLNNDYILSKYQLIATHICPTLHSINNTFLYVNSLRIFSNQYLGTSIIFPLIKNSVEDNILMFSIAVFVGIPSYNIMKITYKHLVAQLFDQSDIKANKSKSKHVPTLFKNKLPQTSFWLDTNKSSKQTLKYAKIYLALTKAIISSLSINSLIASAVQCDDKVYERVYIAGIPTLLALYANFIGRVSLYFKSKRDADTSSLQDDENIVGESTLLLQNAASSSSNRF